ncbi:lysophospholipid acyltransferase [Entophlyctis luteolus]|nr:lysophospholipid acyltransferase [Entophlyctis luteolus]
MQWLQDATGLDKGLIGPGIVMIAAYALTAPFALLESPVLRNLFSVIVSSVLFMALFNVHGVVQITILSIVCYSLSRSFPHSKNVPWIVLALSLGTLAANHIIHQVLSDNASRFDETVPMMVVIQKTAMFAWSVYDGTRSDRLLSTTQKYLKIDSESMPSLLEYLGFIYFYPSFWVGPSFQFKTHMLGADPGYYIFFGTLSLLVTCNRIVRKYIRPLFHDPAGHPLLYKLLPAYHFVGWLTTSLSIYYGTIGMQLKWFNYGMTVWSRLYFFVHVGIAVLYALDYAMSAKGPKRRDGRRAGDKTHENVDLTHAQKKEN